MALLQPIDKAALALTAQAQIKSKISQMFNQLNGGFTDVFNMVWSHPVLSPQEVLDSFGTDAAALFQMSAQTQAFINSQRTGSNVLTPPFAFTVNPDGTVTVGAAITPAPGTNV